MSAIGDFIVVWVIGLVSYPVLYWLFCKLIDRPRKFNIERDFRNVCKDCEIHR